MRWGADRVRRLLRADRSPVILGQQLAAAQAAEARHRLRSPSGPSPLDGVTYDASRGEYDLFRFVRSEVDEQVAQAVIIEGDDDPARLRDALTIDDFYTLLAFIRRSVLTALRSGDVEPLDDAVRALTLLDDERMDWRDTVVNIELVAWALDHVGTDYKHRFNEAATRATRGTAEMLRSVGKQPRRKLTPGMWALVSTPAGKALAQSDFDRYDPTVDLVTAALAIEEVVERDRYRVDALTVATEIPTVWLVDLPTIRRSLDRVRAVVSLSAVLAEGDPQEAQMLLVFVTEAADAADAQAIAEAARSHRDHEAVGVAVGSEFAVMVASSTVVGVPNRESAGGLDRFVADLRAALAAAGQP